MSDPAKIEEEPPAALAASLRTRMEKGEFWVGSYMLVLSQLRMACTHGLCDVTRYYDAAGYLAHILLFHRWSVAAFAAEIEDRMNRPAHIVARKHPTVGAWMFFILEKK